MLDDTRTFQQTLLVFLALEDLLMGTFDDVGEVGLQLHHLTSAVDDIHTVVVVEEQGAVVEMAHAREDLPGAFCLVGREDIGVTHRTSLIRGQEGIELAVMIFQRGGPLTASVSRTFLQIVFG